MFASRSDRVRDAERKQRDYDKLRARYETAAHALYHAKQAIEGAKQCMHDAADEKAVVLHWRALRAARVEACEQGKIVEELRPKLHPQHAPFHYAI